MSLFNRPLKVFMSSSEQAAMHSAMALIARPLSVLEWGSGGSSVHFGAALPAGSQWLAVEHQPKWAKRVTKELNKLKLAHIHVAPVQPNGVHAEGSGDGSQEVFADYVNYPNTLDGQYDFVIVDGRARVPCAHNGWNLLKNEGIMALHDAQRSIYDNARPKDAFMVRIRDPREQVDGADIELHLFLRSAQASQNLFEAVQQVVDAEVDVTLSAPQSAN